MDTVLTSPKQARRCVIIGGGLAGLSTAIALQDAGHHVTLIERRPFLGGRAYSFVDQETGQEVDNGQHVFLGCCTEYQGLLDRLGVLGKTSLQRNVSIPVYRNGGKARSVIAGVPWLPPPAHLLPSFLTYKHLSIGERFSTMRVMLKVMRTDRELNRIALESQSFYDWLIAQGEGARAIERFWNLIILPTLNDDIWSVSAFMGLMVFQESLLGGRHAASIGYSRVGLTALISDAAKNLIEGRGGRMLLGHGAVKLKSVGDYVSQVELADEERVEGDVFVSAVAWDALPKLLPGAWDDRPFFAASTELEAAPIVGVHIWYDRTVMDEEFAAFLDGPAQWVFNKTRIQQQTTPGQYLCVSLSGAWSYASMNKDAIRDLFMDEMQRLFPRAKNAVIERFVVVKQPGATFRCKPGAQANRPPQDTPLANFFLAGDWTQTGWPSTMESAVRSGRMAAEAVAR